MMEVQGNWTFRWRL